MTTETTASTPVFDLVPITKLHESRLNPRKHFNAEALKELAASIKAAVSSRPCTSTRGSPASVHERIVIPASPRKPQAT